MSPLAEIWKDFNVAMVGGLAALVGLLIVAMSVNIAAILKAASLPARGAAAIGTLTYALVVAALGLVPAQPLWLYGVEIAVGAVVLGVFDFHAVRAVTDDELSPGGVRSAKAIMIVLPLVAYAIGAAVLIVGSPVGLGWIAAGAILAVISGVTFAWIVLIEILR